MPAHHLAAAVAALVAAAAAAPAAMAAEIEAESRVVSALVYPRGATIGRVAEFAAPPGRHELVIGDLPVDLDADSLRVAGAARAAAGGAVPEFEILGISHKIREPRIEPLSAPERQALLDRIEALEWSLRAAEDDASEAQARLDYMADFRRATVTGGPVFARRGSAKGEPRERLSPYGGGGDSELFAVSGQWAEGWALIAAESSTARAALREAQKTREALQKDIAQLRDELDQVGPPPPARSVLTVSLAVAAPIDEGALRIEYLTSGARWAPLYDLKLSTEDVAEPGLEGQLSIARRASVSQTTGEDWSGVALSLSTARPSGRVAALKPNALRAVLRPLPRPAAERQRKERAEDRLYAQDEAELNVRGFENAPAPEPAPMAAQTAADAPARLRAIATEQNALAEYSGAGVVYEIREPADVPGDGESRQVLIGLDSAEVDLVARATPSRDETAYLYALYENLDAPLLPGRASLYRDNVFYGQMTLDYVAPGDATALAFGPLDELAVDHIVRTKTTGEEGLFTTSSREQSRFALVARNLGRTPRKITLFDAQPFSETEEIEIAFVGRTPPSERDVEGRRGVLAWTFDLGAGEERRIEFGYDISWPEGRELRVLK